MASKPSSINIPLGPCWFYLLSLSLSCSVLAILMPLLHVQQPCVHPARECALPVPSAWKSSTSRGSYHPVPSSPQLLFTCHLLRENFLLSYCHPTLIPVFSMLLPSTTLSLSWHLTCYMFHLPIYSISSTRRGECLFHYCFVHCCIRSN